nr:hypothetical protein [Candidatus Gracilibacteria bacterium]
DEKKRLLTEARENKFHVSDDGHGHVVVEDATSRRIAAEKQAHTEGAVVGQIEKEKEAEYLKSHHGKDELALEARLKVLNDTADSVIKNLETEARLKLIGENTPEWKAYLEKQSFAKIAQDTLGSTEKISTDDEMQKRTKEGADVDLKALKLTLKANQIHSKEGAEKMKVADQYQKELDKYEHRKKQLENELGSAADDTTRAERQRALDEFEKSYDAVPTSVPAGEEKLSLKDKREKIRDLRLEAKAADAADTEDAKTAREQKEKIEAEAKEMRQKSAMWRYASAKAREVESGRALSVKQNTLLSNVEQIEVHTKRGIDTPTNAITELVEKYEKDFMQMSYEQTVTNMRNSLKVMLDRQTTGDEVSESDSAALAGLFKHAFNNGWVDDAIISIMGDAGLQDMARKTFGWKDQVFDIKKINQIQSLFASGANQKFAEMHDAVGDMLDMATEDFGMSVKEFFEAWETNSFTDAQKGAFQKVVDPEKLKKSVFGEKEGDAAKNVEFYKQVTRDSQAQLQLLGNLRDDAIMKNHPENAGHSQYHDLGGGESLYVMVGKKSARNYVYSDLNKTDVKRRATQHTHATANIDEEDGIVTEVREDDHRLVRNGISNANDRRGTNVRFDNQMSGIAAMEDKTKYLAGDDLTGVVDIKGDSVEGKNLNSAFMVTGTTKNGAYSSRHKNLKRRKKAEYAKMTEAEQIQATVNDTIQKVFARQIRSNSKDFLMGMATQSGIDQNDALSTGKMNLIVSINGKKTKINNINDLIEEYNKGSFGAVEDGKKLNRYIPQDTRARKPNPNDEAPE